MTVRLSHSSSCVPREHRGSREAIDHGFQPDQLATAKSPVPGSRQVFDEMFRTRMQKYPEALAMSFWENHFCTQQALTRLKGKILDVGCGTGEIDILLARVGHEVTGVDVSPVALDVARQHLSQEPPAVQQRVNFVEGLADHLPFPDGSFDSVLLSHVLEHVPHPTPMLKSVARVLRPGGILLVLVPLENAFPDPTHVHCFTLQSLTTLLRHYCSSVETIQADSEQQLVAVCSNAQSVIFPRIICQMRIKNEARWLKRVLDSIARVADGIVILDDGSTDRTPDICQAHAAVVEYRRQDQQGLDEARDKNELLRMAMAHRPDWVLCMDGDEILEDSAPERIYDAIRRCPPDASVLEIEFHYLWNDLEHYRTDGIYQRIFHRRLFKAQGQDSASLSFEQTQHGGNFHCESVPPNVRGRSTEIDVKVKHLGYMCPEDRRQKYEWYKENDPVHAEQGYYEHLLDQPGMTIREWHERPFDRNEPIFADEIMTGGTHKQEIKPDYYYANARRNLIDRVPVGAKRVLDVGCGYGQTGGLLCKERGIEVVGVEIHPEIAAKARAHLTQVLVADVETLDLPFPDGYFDCILFGDVLEHLVNPWQALKRIIRWLNPSGSIVASIPNIRNLGVIKKVLEGSWAYEEWGILDKTHLRFFALKDAFALFDQAGIQASLAEVVRDPEFEKHMSSPPPGIADVDMGKYVVRAVPPQELDELTAIQFIFTGTLKPAERERAGLPMRPKTPEVTIVIPVHNNLDYTRRCVTSLFTVSETVDFEVVVVNNGSTDGTAEYLRALPAIVRTVSLPENLGFAQGCNRGAEAARGKYLVFLNNDTEVLPGWLSAMRDCARRDAAIGLVGNLQIYPDSRKVQQAGIVCGDNGIVYSIYNNQLPADHPAVNKPREFQFVAGSCMLIERDFFHSLGGFDEGYRNSCEDIDLCLRVREAGRKVVYCPQSRIFHYESKTVSGHPKNGDNYQRFLARWRAKLVRDDQKYLVEDGFLPTEPAPPKHETVPEVVGVNADTAPRVALLTTYHQHGDLAKHAQWLVNALATQGIRPLILAEKTDAVMSEDPAGVIRCWTRDPRGGDELLRVIRQNHIDVLHILHGDAFAPDGWLTPLMKTVRDGGVRIVTTFYRTETPSAIHGQRARLSDRILVHHPQDELELMAAGGPVDRIEHVPMGMPPVKRGDLQEAKLALGWNPAATIVSTFGSIEPRTGIIDIIEAMKSVHDKTQATLHVLGRGYPRDPDGKSYVGACRRKAQELGLEEALVFHEDLVSDDETDKVLMASDVIVVNYRYPRFTCDAATTTALASGRPVISTATAAFAFPSMLTIQPTTELDLSQCILRVLENPFVARLLRRHLIEYEKIASWDVVAARIASIYASVRTEPAKSDVDLLHWYRSHPDEIYAEPLQRERVRWLREKAQGRILEIGPANGYVSEFVGAAAAVDINVGRLAVCRALRPGIAFQYGDVVAGLPFRDKEFDAVMAPEILEHVEFEDAVSALKECARVGRRVLLTLPNADKVDYDPDLVHNIEHRWLVNRQTLDRLLNQAGCKDFDLETSSTADFYLVDIRADSRPKRAPVLPLPAVLVPCNVDPEPPLRMVIDGTVFEDGDPRHRHIRQYAYHHFRELVRMRPDWSFKLWHSQPSPASSEIAQLVQSRNVESLAREEIPGLAFDVLYFPHPLSDAAFETLRALAPKSCMTACTFHDLIPLIFGQQYLSANAALKEQYLARLRLLRERCDLFFCTSQSTAEDLQVHLQLPLARLRIVHAGVGNSSRVEPSPETCHRWLARFGLKHGEFLLAMDLVEFHRNAVGVFMGLAAARTVLEADIRLVAVGETSESLEGALRQLARQCGLASEALVIVGHVSDEALDVLHHCARALLFPSLYEGLGAPIVEAMRAGLPVIAGNNSAQKEIAGDAALLVDARNVEEIARGIIEMWQNRARREDLINRGRQQCRRFTWQRVAEKTAVYLAESLARRSLRRKKTAAEAVAI